MTNAIGTITQSRWSISNMRRHAAAVLHMKCSTIVPVRYLQTDGYSGYNALFDTKRGNDVIISVRCMAHARRKFMDALKQQGSPLAQRVVRKIGSLYKIEKDIIGKPQEVRTAIRQEKALPILLSIQSELLHHQSDAHGQISTAIQYTLKAFDALCKYAFDGRLAIDSNTIERSIRPVALTKKELTVCRFT